MLPNINKDYSKSLVKNIENFSNKNKKRDCMGVKDIKSL